MTSLSHHLHHSIKRHTVMSIREGGIQVGIEGTSRGKGISLDARYLNQAADRVASHTQVMLQSHLCRIFYLGRTTTKQLASSSRSHRTSHAYLALTSHVGTTDGSILFHHIAHQTCCSQSTEDALFTHIVRSVHVIQHRRQDTTCATSRSRHDSTTRRILLAHRQGIRIDEPSALE